MDLAQVWFSRQKEIATTDEWAQFAPQVLMVRYYQPLVHLAALAAEEPREAEAALLLEESRRFIDRFLPLATQRALLEKLLTAWHEAAIPAHPEAAQGIARVMGWLTAAETAETSVTLIGAGDCLLTDIRAFLQPLAAQKRIGLAMTPLYLSAAGDGSFPVEEVVRFAAAQQAQILAVSLFTYDGLPIWRLLRAGESRFLPQAIDQAERFLAALRQQSQLPVLLHGASGLPLTGWRAKLPTALAERLAIPPFPRAQQALFAALDEALRQMASRFDHLWFIDETAIARTMGWWHAHQFVTDQPEFREALFHRRRFGAGLARAYLEVAQAWATLRGIKVLAVDFDNTLWEGVMAEGPVRHFRDRQTLLQRLRDHGIVLVALSKNDPAKIRWAEMVLQPDDFVACEIGWDLKPTVLADLAQRLNLGLDSFVFVDDNPTERGLMRQTLPQMRTLDATDPFTWRMLEILPALPWCSQTKEAQERTALYQAQLARQQATVAYGSHGGSDAAVLAALGLVMTVHRMHPEELPRVHELANRTNQFNTTTLRYTEAELRDATRQVWVGYLRDRFGEYGLVLVAALVPQPDGLVQIEDFLMSCRAMGYGAETTFLAAVHERLGAPPLRGRFLPTEKNAPAASFFARCGFTEETPGFWHLPVDASVHEKAPWIQVTFD
jgi:FkbH-like protein